VKPHQDGVVHCQRFMCKLPNCSANRLYHKKDLCCPFCLDHDPYPCLHNNRYYQVSWKLWGFINTVNNANVSSINKRSALTPVQNVHALMASKIVRKRSVRSRTVAREVFVLGRKNPVNVARSARNVSSTCFQQCFNCSFCSKFRTHLTYVSG